MTNPAMPAPERWFLCGVCALTLAAPWMLGLLSPPGSGGLTFRDGANAIAWWAGALVAVLIVSRVLRPLTGPASHVMERVVTAGRAHPRTAIVLSAAVATLMAMYPVVFLGRSLVSPGNGPAPMLYNYPPPFTPGVDDTTIEPAPNADVGAALWQMVPYSAIQRQAIRHGELPLWNRYSSAGRPLLGQGQTGMLDPLHWVVLAAPDLAAGWDAKFVLHRLVFAIGVGLCVFTLTSSWSAAVAMALAAPFARQYGFRLNHPAQFVLTYAPFVLNGWFLLVRATEARERARAALGIALGSALVLGASPPKEAAIMLACCHATGVLASLLAPASWPAMARQLGTATVAILAAALVTAPHWLVFFDTLGQSATLYDEPAVHFAGWSGPISFALGPIGPGVLVSGLNMAATAALCAAFAGGRRVWTAPAPVAAMLGLVLALAVAHGLVPAALLLRIPLLANVGQIDYTFIAAAIVLALVAGGIGARAVLEGRIAGPTLATALAGGAMVALIVVNIGETTSTLSDREVWKAFTIGGLGVLLVPAAGLAARRWPDPLALTTVVLAAAALVVPNGLHVETGHPVLDLRLTQPRLRPAFETDSPAQRIIRAEASGPSRVAGLNGALMAGTQGLYGVEGFSGADALVLPRYEEVLNATGVPRSGSWESFLSPSYVAAVMPVLNLLGIGYAVASPWDQPPAGLVQLPLPGPDRLFVARVPNPWPRAFFVRRVHTYDSMAAFARQVLAATGPFATIDESDHAADLATRGLREPPQSATSADAVVAATAYTLTPNSTRFHVRADGPGVAVLMEAWMERDFVVTINDTPAQYFRVDHAFKGVVIPSSGEWDVAFRYRPAVLTRALGLAAAGALLMCAIGALAVRRRRRV